LTRSFAVTLVACVALISIAGCAVSNAAAPEPTTAPTPKPFPTAPPALKRQARSILNGFSTALIHHDVRRARSFLSPHYFTACNQYLGKNTKYLRCLLDGTPLPVRYRITEIDYASVGSKELITQVVYYFHPPSYGITRSQPFYLNLLPSPHGMRIDSGGIARG
jgi:hypothetical protein